MNQVYSLQEVFANKILKIPDYQRGYSWDLQQWNELLEDIEFLATGKDHYTGNLVLDRQIDTVGDKKGQKHEIFHVVDGQQRITTLVLLLDSVREKLVDFEQDLAQGIESSYIRFKDRSGQPAYKLQLNSDCQEYFVSNVIAHKPGPQGPTIASHERLRDARAYFRNYLDGKNKRLGAAFRDWLEVFYDKITQHLKIGQYIVGDTTEVGVIFEVMNNRGKPLSELEKVKNYLLYVAAKLDVEDHKLADHINAAWTEIFQRLMGAGLNDAGDEDRLLRAHWLMAYDPAKKGWAGSKSVKGRFDLRKFHENHEDLLKHIVEYVRSLKDSVLVFSEIFSPNGANNFAAYTKAERPELRNWATKLTRAGALATFLPILMAIRLRYPKNAPAYLEALMLCELFAFRVYRWGGRRADAGQNRLFRLGYDLFHGTASLEEMSKTVRRRALRYSPDSVFREEFNAHEENSFYGWPGLRYFLYEYELHLADDRNVKMSWDQLLSAKVEKTIEHVLPQTPAAPYWKKRFNAEACRRLTHAIGNLTLTFDNSSYGRKPFPEKRGDPDQQEPCYYGSSLFMEREIAKSFEDWTEEAILNRTEQFKKWATKRWHIESKDLVDDPADVSDAEDEEISE